MLLFTENLPQIISALSNQLATVLTAFHYLYCNRAILFGEHDSSGYGILYLWVIQF